MSKASPSKKILFSLPVDLVVAVDKYAQKNDYNRSEFIRYAIRSVLKNESIQPV